jgi:hypothetical protein
VKKNFRRVRVGRNVENRQQRNRKEIFGSTLYCELQWIVGLVQRIALPQIHTRIRGTDQPTGVIVYRVAFQAFAVEELHNERSGSGDQQWKM